ncbi:MAG: hypothetical protein VX290_00845, partial [Candidatus Latescibacterota bacterium]|nr:hypothetical protein [Candidatus Latescibacterota bacterium]
AVCFLWHCLWGHPPWALPSTLPCGARTFLTDRNRRAHPDHFSLCIGHHVERGDLSSETRFRAYVQEPA